MHFLDAQNWDLQNGLSLYIHIPFCTHKCYFCDFFSVQGWSAEQQNTIVHEIFDQTQQALTHLKVKSLRTAYMGGGTPSLLSAKQLDRFLNLLTTYAPSELTLEANPESLKKDWCETLFSYPNTRLSLGIQSFLTHDLQPLGRIVELSHILNSLKIIQPYASQINLDLMVGLHGHNWTTLRADLDRVIAFAPAHISFYMLTLEEGTPLFRKPHLVLNEEDRIELWMKGKYYLKNAGYIDYEISNFTKNTPSQHNQRYWQLDPYLGIGPGAVGNIPLKTGGAIRIEGSKNLKKWLQFKNQSQLYAVEHIPEPAFLFDHLMMGWRTQKGICEKKLGQRFGDDHKDLIQQIATLYPQWVCRSNGWISLNEEGRMHLDQILIKALETQE
ncbi:MAG: radical SAM family heme chaperone HemW [Spirochaetia bacterium]